jgi:hypothetical protein
MITRTRVYYYMSFIAIVAALEPQNHMWPQLSNFAVLCLWELANSDRHYAELHC